MFEQPMCIDVHALVLHIQDVLGSALAFEFGSAGFPTLRVRTTTCHMRLPPPCTAAS